MAETKRIVTPYDDLTYRVIGCAMAVHRKLGPGLREDTYQRGLETALAEHKIDFEAQKLYEVVDPDAGGALLGYYIPDFVVGGKCVVEIKALNRIDGSHFAQVIGYLAVTGCPLGLLLNFGERSLFYRRIFPPKDVCEHRVNRQWLFVPESLRPAQS